MDLGLLALHGIAGSGLGASRPASMPAMVEAVVFDMDGVLVDSEALWDAARSQVALKLGGRWSDQAQRDMMGMSSSEWSRYMHEQLEVPLAPERINDEVVARMERLYHERLPLIPGAREAAERLARWPLGIASSANRPLIELALELAGLRNRFAVIVSSEEVARGKPAPDVYLEAARRLDVPPERCAAIEDSHSGILAARAAGMRVVAIPNRAFPPGEDALARAHMVLESVTELEPSVVAGDD
jgi:HAD superfamily hydrolase (TIGR01509 family)